MTEVECMYPATDCVQAKEIRAQALSEVRDALLEIGFTRVDEFMEHFGFRTLAHADGQQPESGEVADG